MPDIYVKNQNQQTNNNSSLSDNTTTVSNQSISSNPQVQTPQITVEPTQQPQTTSQNSVAKPLNQAVNTQQPTQNSNNWSSPAPVAPMNPQMQNQWNDPWAAPMGGGSNWNDPWAAPMGGGSNWNDPWANPSGGRSQGQAKKMTPEERVTMIEKLYQEVLGRKAETKDINYYKYSTLGEEEIRRQLVTGKEHTELMTNGREFANMKKRAEDAEGQVKVLDGQIRDQIEEFRKLAELLKEKNRFIQQLRSRVESPFSTQVVQAADASQQFKPATSTSNQFSPVESNNRIPQVPLSQLQSQQQSQSATQNNNQTKLQSRIITGINRVIGV